MDKDPGKGFVAAEGTDETYDRLGTGFAKVIKSKGHEAKYQKNRIDYLKNKLDSGTIIEELGIPKVVEHYTEQDRNIWKNVHLQAKDKDGKNIGGQQSEIDFLVFSSDGSLPPEIVSAKMNGSKVAPGDDLGNLANFYKLNISDGKNVLSHDLQTYFDSPVYRHAEGIVVKYTDIKTGEIREISLQEFREKLPESINSDTGKYNAKVIGLAPDDTHSKRGIDYIGLGIEQQPLLEKITNIIDEEIGDL